jgi:dihydropteroate synthase
VPEVVGELAEAVEVATSAGISEARIVVDPGLGISKTIPQNLQLLDQLPALQSLGRPMLVGPSRKRFLAGDHATAPPATRDTATAAACVVAWERGARVFRVHDVATTRDALRLLQSIDQSLEPA